MQVREKIAKKITAQPLCKDSLLKNYGEREKIEWISATEIIMTEKKEYLINLKNEHKEYRKGRRNRKNSGIYSTDILLQ